MQIPTTFSKTSSTKIQAGVLSCVKCNMPSHAQPIRSSSRDNHLGKWMEKAFWWSGPGLRSGGIVGNINCV